MLLNRIGHVVEAHRLAAQHPGQHLLQTQHVGRTDAAGQAGAVGLVFLAGLLRQVALASGLHSERAKAKLLNQPPAWFHALPGQRWIVNLQLFDSGKRQVVQAGGEIMHALLA